MIDEFVAKHTQPGRQRKHNINRGRQCVPNLCVYVSVCVKCASYGFVLLKIKKALPSGIGVIFSFFTSSEMTGRGPDGTSGSSSSAAVSSLSSSSSLWTSRKVYSQNIPPQTVQISDCKMPQGTFSSFSSSFLSLQRTEIPLLMTECERTTAVQSSKI